MLLKLITKTNEDNMNENARILSAFENRLRAGRLCLTHYVNKSSRWAKIPMRIIMTAEN